MKILTRTLQTCGWIYGFATLLCLVKPTYANEGALPGGIQHLVPVGRINVDVMQLQLHARQIEIGKKLMAVARAHPEIYRELLQKSAGKVLPYDPRMGVSAAEYKVFMTLKPYFKKVAEATVNVTSKGTLRTFDGGKALPALTGIIIDMGQGKVTTRYGVLSVYHVITPKAGQAMGPWSGVAWTVNTAGRNGFLPGQMEQGGMIEVGVGQIKSNGRCLFFCRVQQIENKVMRDKEFTTIEYAIK